MPLYTCRKSAAKLPCRLWATGIRARRSFETYRTRDAPKLCLVGVGQFLGKPKTELNYPSPLVLGCSLNTSRLTHGPTLKKRSSPEQVAKQLPSAIRNYNCSSGVLQATSEGAKQSNLNRKGFMQTSRLPNLVKIFRCDQGN